MSAYAVVGKSDEEKAVFAEELHQVKRAMFDAAVQVVLSKHSSEVMMAAVFLLSELESANTKTSR